MTNRIAHFRSHLKSHLSSIFKRIGQSKGHLCQITTENYLFPEQKCISQKCLCLFSSPFCMLWCSLLFTGNKNKRKCYFKTKPIFSNGSLLSNRKFKGKLLSNRNERKKLVNWLKRWWFHWEMIRVPKVYNGFAWNYWLFIRHKSRRCS